MSNETKTLILGDMEAQFKIWNRYILPQSQKVSRVISLGNLISCSDESKDKEDYGRNEAILALWEDLDKVEKIKIIGCNEMAALNYPDQWTNSKSNIVLRNQWLSPQPKYHTAYSFNGVLLTHGGLTYGEWLSIGKPANSDDAAKLLNEKYNNTLKQGKSFKTTGVPNLYANPIWSDPVTETYPSWIFSNEQCPFHQIHGDVSLNNPVGRESVHNGMNRYADKKSYKKYGSEIVINDTLFIAVDLSLKNILEPSLPRDKTLYVAIS